LLALSDAGLAGRLDDFRRRLASEVEDKNRRLARLGVEAYLAESGLGTESRR
jgi:hypothetical protein